MSKRVKTEYINDPDDINDALRVLREECEGHLDCYECPLVLVDGQCGLMNTEPHRYPEVDGID